MPVLQAERPVLSAHDVRPDIAFGPMWRKWAPFLAMVLVRARFLVSPMAIDEGGYLAVARAWFHGADLYGKVWVDQIGRAHV